MNDKHPPITEQTDGIDIHPIQTSSSKGSVYLNCWDFAGQVCFTDLLHWCPYSHSTTGIVSNDPSILHQQQQCIPHCLQHGSIWSSIHPLLERQYPHSSIPWTGKQASPVAGLLCTSFCCVMLTFAPQVGTHADMNICTPNHVESLREQLRQHVPEARKFVPISCIDQFSIFRLRKIIVKLSVKEGLLGKAIPSHFKAIQTELRELNQPLISWDRYRSLLEKAISSLTHFVAIHPYNRENFRKEWLQWRELTWPQDISRALEASNHSNTHHPPLPWWIGWCWTHPSWSTWWDASFPWRISLSKMDCSFKMTSPKSSMPSICMCNNLRPN